MHKTIIAIGSLLTGVAAGILMTSTLSAQVRRPSAGSSSNPRLVITDVTKNTPTGDSVFFIRDTKTNGCWLGYATSLGSSIASAPTEACQMAASEPTPSH